MGAKQTLVRFSERHLLYLEDMLQADAEVLIEDGGCESDEYALVQTLLGKVVRGLEGFGHVRS